MGSGVGFKPTTWHFHPMEIDLTGTNAFLNLEREPQPQFVTTVLSRMRLPVPPLPRYRQRYPTCEYRHRTKTPTVGRSMREVGIEPTRHVVNPEPKPDPTLYSRYADCFIFSKIGSSSEAATLVFLTSAWLATARA
jgi:hypothetical protein